MISDGYASGFGSEVHVIGSHLAYAIQNNYILLLGPGTCKMFVNSSTCKKGCGCYFRPLSHCGNITELNKNKSIPRLKNTHSWGSLVPDQIKQALIAKMPSITHDERKYWWRAQSAGYIMRLNDETVRAVSALRQDPALHYVSNGSALPFPLASGTIAAHIRHGDKKSEMKLVPAKRCPHDPH